MAGRRTIEKDDDGGVRATLSVLMTESKLLPAVTGTPDEIVWIFMQTFKELSWPPCARILLMPVEACL